ncbi:response regulator [Algoriphagus sp. A40]|uniref:response regulator n=1 Tax=Algoriphagus sp. A40 TaxID=1945863 RepID=UPI00098679B8|nr:response regulator [Algoriphagus sp. A40]OOG76529.1 hypothetical protein B0E43_08590 [Algoriphagus sp. A40]
MNPELILVDDDSVLLLVLQKMIRRISPESQIDSFSSGKDALDFLTSNSDPTNPIFLLVDINLNDMSSWDFLSLLQTRNLQYHKIILMTSSISSSNSDLARKYPSVIGFFEKPITFENFHQIFEMIRKEKKALTFSVKMH